jgi:hypothetical protein
MTQNGRKFKAVGELFTRARLNVRKIGGSEQPLTPLRDLLNQFRAAAYGSCEFHKKSSAQRTESTNKRCSHTSLPLRRRGDV